MRSIHSTYFLKASSIFLILFFANVLTGKLSMLVFHYQLPLGIGEVAEFILLFITCTLFVIAILLKEHECRIRNK